MQVPLLFVTDLNVTWKFVTKMYVTIGRQKVGQTGQHGETVQNHVVVALESDDGYARIVIIIAMIPGNLRKHYFPIHGKVTTRAYEIGQMI